MSADQWLQQAQAAITEATRCLRHGLAEMPEYMGEDGHWADEYLGYAHRRIQNVRGPE